jgi:hypothetical protein|tara:strand:+ start:1850 stop:2005 length:156 start_codon:yes stop_codon:yes gene_type:complete
MLTFLPVRTEEEIIMELHHVRNDIALLKIRQNKLIDELVETKGGSNAKEDK